MESLIPAISGLVGVVTGIIAKGFFDLYSMRKKNLYETKFKQKETRFKAILLLMYSYLNYEKEKVRLLRHRSDLVSKEDLSDELHAEWTNMTLYATDSVIIKMKTFLETPDIDNFNSTILAMRRSLYAIKTNLTEKELRIQPKPSNSPK
jgi:hypothetical protein